MELSSHELHAATAEACGMELSSHELAFFDRVLKAEVATGGDEGRTALADQIEREDAEAERRWRERQARKEDGGMCCSVM